ncbi:hypothetical protein QBZ16_004529 [Prototheca wickerhamii]|uniref:Uncharacterized protein n=1 Tax=Prototheca wickerhamii TaxID=3111 RepID=A0AAD9IHI1_PROWI|nr:hypothetical protein QBZ16_004529 [Prototheca wickerhamii]
MPNTGITADKEIGARAHWLHVRRMPLLLVTGVTVASFGWWWYQKGRNDPSFLTEEVTRKGGLGEAELPLGEMAARQQHYDEKKYGRKSAIKALEGKSTH